MSRLVIIGLAWVLGVATALSGTPGAAEVAFTARSGATGTQVPFSCPAGATTIEVAGSAQPSEVPDGGTVVLTITMRVPDTPALDEAGEVWISQPLPAEVAAVSSVVFGDTEGVVDTAWSAAPGMLTMMLTPDPTSAPSELAATVAVTIEFGIGLAPASVAIAAPDGLAIGPARDGDTGPRPCTRDGAGATLFTVTVVESSGPGAPPPAPETPATAPEPPVTSPDPASAGDAPSPPPLTPDETPVVPPGPDPGAASQVVTGDVAGARAHLDDALEGLRASSDRVEALGGRLDRMEATERALEAERSRLAAAIDRVSADLGRRVADAYTDAVDAEPGGVTTNTEAAWMRMVRAGALVEYERLLARQAEVLDELSGAAADRAGRQVSLDGAEADRRDLRTLVSDRTYELNTFLGGGQVAVSGFRFVVGGDHSFSDTWQAPRAGGRKHQGTDIFADEGTPLYAAERGALARVGTDDLGGTKLWVVGESGTHYYYAHLSRYAAGMADGVVVEAGQMVGYVGHTGDARTTPPHLHFEVHPAGGPAVNSYPMLVAADTGVAAPTPEPPEPAAEPPAPEPVRSPATEGSDPGADSDLPRRVAIDASGNEYVADATNDRVQRFDADGTPMTGWGGTGSGKGRFRHPTGVAVGPTGDVYVADTHNNRIQKFTAGGRFLTAWGTTGAQAGRFNHPADVAVDATGIVYVADTYNNRIQVFDGSGEHLDSWGTLGTDDGSFTNPYGVAVDTDGDVYVADTFNGRVQRFTASGRFVATFGSGVAADGGLQRPAALSVDEDGMAWVADQDDDLIRQFDETGAFVQTWDRLDLAAVGPDRGPEVAIEPTSG
jgi:hypothetical protein